MRLHRLRFSQTLPATPGEAWRFFADPGNLARITPPWLDFRVTSDPPPAAHAGMIVTYRIRPLPGLDLRWITEITHLREPEFFVDEQRFGPYRFWHHQHHFRPTCGGVEVEDLVHYALPLGPLGDLVHRLAVRRRLEEIFGFRRAALEKIFEQGVKHADPAETGL